MEKIKKVAIIGGGVAGIVSIVMLKEEGMETIHCYEKTDKPGGTWCYREQSEIGVPSLMPTTVINNSKEFGAFSTYPPKKESSNFMRHQDYYKYLMDYANKNDALKYIRYNTEVTGVKRSLDYEETGRWVVSVKNNLDGSVTTDVYDGIVVCVGHLNIPKWPTYENQESFKGKMIHTHSLKEVSDYKDKVVVVVGMGCSGLDAAVDISRTAKQVYLSTRSGAHVLTRVGPYGYPLDYLILRRYLTSCIDYLPTNFLSWLLETYYLDTKFNSRLYPVKPKWHVLSKDPTINEQLATLLMSGHIVQKPDILKFTKDGVVFEGDTLDTKVDAVIMGTGYTWDFPFLEKDIIIEDENRINLYKCMWPPKLKHPTLAFIGFILSYGPGIPLGEMQSRWLAQVFARNVKLPSEEEMMKDIIKRHEMNALRFKPNSKQTIRVDYTQYLDEISELFGAKPNFLKLFFTDPKLYFKLWFGPCVPYQYRLQGPHPWAGAKEAILSTEERILWPIKREEMLYVESSFIIFFKKLLATILPNV